MRTLTVACADGPALVTAGIGVVELDGLCQDPATLKSLDGSVERIVLLLHRGSYQLPDIQKALRSIDIDPLGAQILDVDGEADPDTSQVAIAGLVSRAAAYGGSQPEQAKPVLPKAISRRAFLRPPVPAYIGSPLIDHRVCAADKGCMACADVCPKDAYLWTEGRIVYAKNECEPCGQCVTTCPTEAISNPTATPAMIEAQVKALIAAAPNPIGARFVCSRGSGRQVEGWANISVPCTSMVPGSWLLATMLIGAAGAYAEPCADSSCPLGLDAQTNQANELAHAVLEECHLDPSVVSGTTLGAPIGPVAIDDPFGRRRTPEIIAALATAASTAIDIAHPAADLGIVSIDDATCTLCGRCAQACPTHALAESYEDDVVSISFDAKACVNCTQCISACPEVERGAIAVTGRYWVDALDAGRTELNSGTITSCEICGNAIAPTLMMDRIRDILGDEFAGSMSTIGKRCLDCRGR